MSISTPKLADSKSQCANPKIENLIRLIQRECSIREQSQTETIKKDQSMHHSLSARATKSSLQSRPMFNNKTREGDLMDPQFRSGPYLFIPGFKNNDFMAPDRVFQKGNAGKRFTIKMRDTSPLSFREGEPVRYSNALRRAEKERTIMSRQYEQFSKIIDQNDGKLKANANRQLLKARRHFRPVHASEFFAESEPLLGPKDIEAVTLKKVSLAKTFDYQKKWRPTTRTGQVFSASVSNSVYSHAHHVSSVR